MRYPHFKSHIDKVCVACGCPNLYDWDYHYTLQDFNMGSPHHGVIESVACKLLPHDKDEGVYHVETIPFQCLHLVKAIKYKIQDRVDHIAFEKQVLKDLMWKRLGR